MTTKWFPGNFLSVEKIKNVKNYAVIVLNRPINANKEVVECLWSQASLKITVDGGTNRWLSWIRKHSLEDKLKHPNFITGDLDSCSTESIAFFNKSRVIKTVDQDETDFTKSLRVLEPSIKELNLENSIVLCETSGRMDQILANINTLFKNNLKSKDKQIPIFLFSANSLSWLLAPGHHEIHIPENVKKFWCALIPFEPTKVSTNGLKWNLKNQTLKFGGIVSTSNTYDCTTNVVNITTDNPLLWSMGTSKIDDD
ncbi:CLUMA_CG005329, isoform A [Clunio marinus]|uniref:CLUMA_CG005329, isoform A n=1 Tax=Clunio marinus TaxID=568069 RepID=A0A1J1HZX1_9DIPT|nr:CLUMA_CG005329, isoform A [Clunio marinus]